MIDARAEHIAATEAHKSGVPVVAWVNSETNIKKIESPIVANDAGIPSIKFFAAAVAEAYKKNANTNNNGAGQKT